MRLFSKYMKIICLVLLAFAAVSCGTKPIGYGVMYVEDQENNLKPAEVLPVYQESDIRDVYILSPENAERSIEVSRWKLNFFKNQTEAESFAERYKALADIYASTEINGLSIRSEEDVNSERVYKLRQGQIIKIIGRSDKKEEIAGHSGYWYKVLTEDGVSGYAFDLNLNIYNRKETGDEEASIASDPMLNEFLSKPFRPEYFRDMIRDNMIDLKRFKTTFGIFPYPDEKRIILSTREHNLTFEYTEITKSSTGRFIFEGTSLQVLVRDEDRIAVFFTSGNREYSETMIYIPNMDELIESEIERRELLFERIADLGTVSSSAYGKIEFHEDKTFDWSNYRRLVPNIIPEIADGTGRISLDYFPGLALREEYDGVLSFAFSGVPGGGLVNFLFELSDLGIKLVHVPAGDIEKNIVEQESSSPLVIFMSGAGE
jgi:hypothetical protein